MVFFFFVFGLLFVESQFHTYERSLQWLDTLNGPFFRLQYGCVRIWSILGRKKASRIKLVFLQVKMHILMFKHLKLEFFFSTYKHCIRH